MQHSRLVNIRLVLALVVVALSYPGVAAAQSCVITCAAIKQESTTGAIPTVAGLTFSSTVGTPVGGTALANCVFSSQCNECTAATSVQFIWTGAPASRFKVWITNWTGSSEAHTGYFRTGTLYRDCPNDS